MKATSSDRMRTPNSRLGVKRLNYAGVLLRMAKHWLAYRGLGRVATPLTLTYSVTNRCQSRCRTCSIWKLYREHPDLEATELDLEEIEKVFRTIGRVYFFNISGGEPFLRPDLPEIVALALKYLAPAIVHIPTNALSPTLVEQGVARVLQVMREAGHERTPLTVKPSLDGIGEQHDQIRGVAGSFDRVMEAVELLKSIRDEHPNLHVELGTVISTYNVHSIPAIADFVQTLGVEGYRNEVAEIRAELLNSGQPITPSANEYGKAIAEFQQRIRSGIGGQRAFTKVTEALRLVYYDYATRVLAEGRQVIPCLAGITNAHLNPYGQVWACCTLGYDRPLGDVRESGYDFNSVWNSRQAQRVRMYIRDGNCACPLANQMYSNILLNARGMARVLATAARFGLGA
jgi:MoaA/NifB/PqqE/SkfB family radical SAM enzyme